MLSRTSKTALIAAGLCWNGFQAAAQITALPAHPPMSAVNAVEYFFDTDPGYGNGQPLTTGSGNDIAGAYTVPIGMLSKGAHRLFVRSRNSAGSWSNAFSQELVIYSLVQALPQSLGGTQVSAAEYFVDTDPGAGRAAAIALPGPGTDLTAANVAVDITGLSLGLHRVYFRTQNQAGQWSLSSGSAFTILINTIHALPAHPAATPITAIEYFIDTDPGFGNGKILNVPATTDLSNQTVAVDITGLAGTHTLFFRSINGHSMTTAHSFSVTGTPLPLSWLSTHLRAESMTAVLSWTVSQTADCLAYEIERSTDGRKFEQISVQQASITPGIAEYSFRDERPLPGLSWYRICLKRADGASKFSPVMSLRRGAAVAEIRINNPASGTLMIKRLGEGAETLDLSIRNASGQELLHPGRGDALQSIDLSPLSAGIYLLCWQQDGKAMLQKFVKQ